MPEPANSNETLSQNEILHQAAGLADHLSRMGVQWLPSPISSNVGSIIDQLASEEPERATPDVAETRAHPAPVSAVTESTSTASADAPSTVPPSTQPAAPAFQLATENAAGSRPYTEAALDGPSRAAKLQTLNDAVASCTRCTQLSNCRTKTVFGEGSPTPRIVFFGEGPGRDEDLSGRPFVGKAGDLLTKMIQACKLSREEVYIMNTVKCRPPNNRNPEPSEIQNCREYYEAQLQTLQPEYIVCLGLISAQALLDTKLSVGRLRGKFHHHYASKVIVTYHPAYLLRTPSAKRAAWDDLQFMLRDAGLL